MRRGQREPAAKRPARCQRYGVQSAQLVKWTGDLHGARPQLTNPGPTLPIATRITLRGNGADHLCGIACNDAVRRVRPRADGAKPDDRIPSNAGARQNPGSSGNPDIFIDTDRGNTDRRVGIVPVYARAVEIRVENSRIGEDRAWPDGNFLLTAEPGDRK